MKLKITKQAKEKAKKALELRKKLPKSKKFGITKKEAEKLGINSGVERAKQIVRNDFLVKEKDIKAVCRFKRWTNRKQTLRVKGAVDLWGGKRFIKKACETIKKD